MVPLASVAARMLGASFLVVGLVVVAIVLGTLAVAAASRVGDGGRVIPLIVALILLPMLYLLTRLSLFAPALSSEKLRPLSSLGRSNEPARGRIWLVFRTATFAFVRERTTMTQMIEGPAPADLACGLYLSLSAHRHTGPVTVEHACNGDPDGCARR